MCFFDAIKKNVRPLVSWWQKRVQSNLCCQHWPNCHITLLKKYRYVYFVQDAYTYWMDNFALLLLFFFLSFFFFSFFFLGGGGRVDGLSHERDTAASPQYVKVSPWGQSIEHLFERNNKQREVRALNRQGTQQRKPQSFSVTPPSVRVNAAYMKFTKGASADTKAVSMLKTLRLVCI